MTATKEKLEALWADPANWKAGCIYKCPDDPRIVVHKRIKWTGYTMNFAHSSAYTALFLIVAFLTLPMALLFVLPPAPAVVAMLATEIIAIICLIFYCKWETNRY